MNTTLSDIWHLLFVFFFCFVSTRTEQTVEEQENYRFGANAATAHSPGRKY